jgi:hypothetical protein
MNRPFLRPTSSFHPAACLFYELYRTLTLQADLKHISARQLLTQIFPLRTLAKFYFNVRNVEKFTHPAATQYFTDRQLADLYRTLNISPGASAPAGSHNYFPQNNLPTHRRTRPNVRKASFAFFLPHFFSNPLHFPEIHRLIPEIVL